MKKFGLREWNGQEENMVDGHQVGRVVNEGMQEAERSSLAHTFKGGRKEETMEHMQEDGWKMDDHDKDYGIQDMDGMSRSNI